MSSSLDIPSQVHAFIVAPEQTSARLDKFLAAVCPDQSRTRLKALIEAGHVTADGREIRDPAAKVHTGGRIMLTIPPPVPATPEGEHIALDIVYEDAHLLVLDKPAGLVVHPAGGHESGTLVNALIAHCGDTLSGIGGERRPGIVHRLDKDTSGLLVVAKSDKAHRGLARQFADHGRTGPLERAYRAFIWGVPARAHGTIHAAIGRSHRNREKMAVSRPGDGREAITHYDLIEVFTGVAGKPLVSLVDCRLETGRTHQIRVHLTHIGHPLLGDALYGGSHKTKSVFLNAAAKDALVQLNRQALHAAVLGFEHPISSDSLRFESALPADLAALLSSLRAK